MLPQVVSLDEEEDGGERLFVPIDDAQKVSWIVVSEVLVDVSDQRMVETHGQHVAEDWVEHETQLLLRDEFDEVRPEVCIARARVGEEGLWWSWSHGGDGRE